MTAEINSPEGCTRELRSASTQTDESIASEIGNVVNQVSIPRIRIRHYQILKPRKEMRKIGENVVNSVPY